MFDLLTKADPTLTKRKEAEDKVLVRELLARLKAEKLTLDWRKHSRSRAVVRSIIEQGGF